MMTTMRATPIPVRDEIQRLRAKGATPKEIMARLGVTYGVVHKYGGVASNTERGIGDRYGRLTIIARRPGGLAVCNCDCGNETTVSLKALKHSVRPQKSCGCLRAELTELAREDMSGRTVNGFTGVEFVRPGDARRGNGPIWRVNCPNGHAFETAKKKWKKGEIACRECAVELRQKREADRRRRARINAARLALERERRAAVRAAVKLMSRQTRRMRRDLERERRRLGRHAHCYGRHSLGRGRTATCAEYEAERTRQSLKQGGDGKPEGRADRKRNFDFTPGVVRGILWRDGFRCLRCRRHRSDLEDGERLEADHVIAGVGTSMEDGQTLCSTCHTWKHKSSSRDGLDFRVPS